MFTVYTDSLEEELRRSAPKKQFSLETKKKQANNGTEMDIREKSIREASYPGTKCDIYFDKDWDIFSPVLACYNNHWVQLTSADDWWKGIVRVFEHN